MRQWNESVWGGGCGNDVGREVRRGGDERGGEEGGEGGIGKIQAAAEEVGAEFFEGALGALGGGVVAQAEQRGNVGKRFILQIAERNELPIRFGEGHERLVQESGEVGIVRGCGVRRRGVGSDSGKRFVVNTPAVGAEGSEGGVARDFQEPGRESGRGREAIDAAGEDQKYGLGDVIGEMRIA